MKQDRGLRAYHAGFSAEEAVAKDYESRGHVIETRRFRRKSGEIDLVARKGSELVFIEVKQSKSHETAALALSARQLARIYRTASEYLAEQPNGQDTLSRVDVALVDGQGRVECLENVQLN
jgi:putative endonuclease